LVAITSPVRDDECVGASPYIPLRELVIALQPLMLRVAIVRNSALHASCKTLSALYESLTRESSGSGIEVVQLPCTGEACSLHRQLSQVSQASTGHDAILLVTWHSYRNGFDIECSGASCLRPVVEALFSHSEDSSRCNGATRALSISFASASCQEVAAGNKVSEFVLNPSPALSVHQVSLVTSEAFAAALRAIFADDT
jgi:hypothetical protein